MAQSQGLEPRREQAKRDSKKREDRHTGELGVKRALETRNCPAIPFTGRDAAKATRPCVQSERDNETRQAAASRQSASTQVG